MSVLPKELPDGVINLDEEQKRHDQALHGNVADAASAALNTRVEVAPPATVHPLEGKGIPDIYVEETTDTDSAVEKPPTKQDRSSANIPVVGKVLKVVGNEAEFLNESSDSLNKGNYFGYSSELLKRLAQRAKKKAGPNAKVTIK